MDSQRSREEKSWGLVTSEKRSTTTKDYIRRERPEREILNGGAKCKMIGELRVSIEWIQVDTNQTTPSIQPSTAQYSQGDCRLCTAVSTTSTCPLRNTAP